MKRLRSLLPLLSCCAAPLFASVNVAAPANNAAVTSPVAYTATGASTTCSSGVAAMGVYVNNVLAFKQNGASLNTSLTLATGKYQTTVIAWDRCGGASTTPIAITVGTIAAKPTGLTVTAPVAGSTVSSPVAFAATAASSTCAKGVSSMGIYVGNVLQYKASGSTLAATLPFAPGAQRAVLQEWDKCGGSVTSPVSFVVAAASLPTISFTASPTSVATGVSSTLSWSTSNATAVSIDNGIGAVATTGTLAVTPTQTTTYTLTATGANGSTSSTATVSIATVSTTNQTLTGVMEWKGNPKRYGQYNQETTLTPASVTPALFGKVRDMPTDGAVQGQPMYVRGVNLGGTLGVHDLLIVTTEHDSVYAFDGLSTATTPIWKRSFLNAAAGITVQPDNHGGRSTFGGEVGISGTPVIDAATGILYVVAATSKNSVITDTLHALDIRTGNDAGAGSVAITASVAGTGLANVNGSIAFAPSQQNQRAGLVLDHGVLYVPFGSFSDAPPYHGWLFAYDPATLKQLAVFNTTPNYRADYDTGSGAAFWSGGAAPSFEDDGSFFIVAADGSTDVENGGTDYGDTVLHMQYSNGAFSVLDWFTPFNRDCIDKNDIEMGSGGLALLPEAEVGNGRKLGVVLTKEGRLYLLDRTSLGHFDATADQAVQMFMVGDHQCDATTTGAASDGDVWNRFYGNASYWSGNLYMAASNQPIKQFAISGTSITTTPVAVGSATMYHRGGNTVVSSFGNTNGIVWEYQKTADGNAVLHAFDATNVAKELWNSAMNLTRDGMISGGQQFQTPVVIDGKVIVESGLHVVVYEALPPVTSATTAKQ